MNPLMIQAIAADQDRAVREHAAAWQRARQSQRASDRRRHGWLRWPGAGRGPASRHPTAKTGTFELRPL